MAHFLHFFMRGTGAERELGCIHHSPVEYHHTTTHVFRSVCPLGDKESTEDRTQVDNSVHKVVPYAYIVRSYVLKDFEVLEVSFIQIN